ncbi:MAG: hypothetical protein M3459_13285 [Actinomycetota bacterium]|nr:hypothetical protein [Actinomycetota bacterium]
MGTLGVVLLLALGVGACGGGSKKSKAPPTVDPVAMALTAPGVRTVVIPEQSEELTIAVPPCGSGQVSQETTETPPGSSEIVVPEGSLAQTVAVQPCIKGQTQQSSGAGTVLISPGGAATGQSETQLQSGAQGQNQLVIPQDSDLRRIIVPPCLVTISSSSSSSSSSAGGATSNTLALPATSGNGVVTAPPCSVDASSSSSSGG